MAQNATRSDRDPVQRVMADIVFSLDASFSMGPVIQGLMATIRSFVEGLPAQGTQLHARIGFIANKWRAKAGIEFIVKRFTESPDEFIAALSRVSPSGNEATLPAIDWALDFPWRPDAHKFVIHFTDETVENGWNPQESAAKLPELQQKIRNLGCRLLVVGRPCPEFSLLSSFERCLQIEIRKKEDLAGDHFTDLMSRLQKKVSTGTLGMRSAQRPVKKDLFGLAGRPDLKVIEL